MKKGLNRGKGIPGREEIAKDEALAHRNSIGLPPLQRVKRAPGEVNPRHGKGGGFTRGHNMIERGRKKH